MQNGQGSSSSVDSAQNLDGSASLQDAAGATGTNHLTAMGFHAFPGSSGMNSFASASGYSLPGNSGHPGVPGHYGAHHANPGPSGYHAHAAGSHMHHHQGHTGHPMHHWYQGYHHAQMQNAGNPYCMQDDQFMWQHHHSMFPNDYVDFLGHNIFQMSQQVPHMYHHQQQLDGLPSL